MSRAASAEPVSAADDEPPVGHSGDSKWVECTVNAIDWVSGGTSDRVLRVTAADEEYLRRLRGQEAGGPGPVLRTRSDLVAVAAHHSIHAADWDPVTEPTVTLIWQACSRGRSALTCAQLHDAVWTLGCDSDGGLADCSTHAAERLLRWPGMLRAVWPAVVGDSSLPVCRADFAALLQFTMHKAVGAARATEIAGGRQFWGYGSVDSGPTPSAFWSEEALLRGHEPPPSAPHCCGLLYSDSGRLEDLWYYLCQHHGVLRIALADAVHPLTLQERVGIEVAVCGCAAVLAAVLPDPVVLAAAAAAVCAAASRGLTALHLFPMVCGWPVLASRTAVTRAAVVLTAVVVVVVWSLAAAAGSRAVVAGVVARAAASAVEGLAMLLLPLHPFGLARWRSEQAEFDALEEEARRGMTVPALLAPTDYGTACDDRAFRQPPRRKPTRPERWT
eukprot:TRINITY_DN10440_c0_g1_i1.p1 TRINITY_DN10440_c0_g1~~TRINITY_DN10440_c0_g1_i1.p1  ORF type:complete len:484 (+),score=157.31 TRINITY_DN10440_c0_g1_i1:119-1453(+)